MYIKDRYTLSATQPYLQSRRRDGSNEHTLPIMPMGVSTVSYEPHRTPLPPIRLAWYFQPHSVHLLCGTTTQAGAQNHLKSTLNIG